MGMRTQFKACVVTVPLVFYAMTSWSADIYVSPTGGGDGSIINPTDLQSALITAQTNGTADTIYLQEGTYDAGTGGENTYEYGSGANDGMKVTLSGSWSAGYTIQKTTEAPSTTLDGGGTSRVMDIHADTASFDFAIEYLNIDNGYLAAGNGHGVGIRAVQDTGLTLNLFLLHVGFQDNTAQISSSGAAGGGMYINSYFEARECRFKDNWSYTAGAIYIAGTDVNVSPIIDNCEFDGNISGNSAWLNTISTLFFANSPVITNSTFRGNPAWSWSASALNGGAGINLTVSNCVFSDFHTYYWGGAIHIWDYDATISNSLFVNNSAGEIGDGRGGAIAIYDPTAASPRTVTVTNCTFFGNRANLGSSEGGAIHNRVQTLIVSNSIFWNNDSYDIYNTGTATIRYSDIEGGLAGTFFTDGGNNINSNPLFANTTGDPITWDFQLTAGSPAMDTGDNTVLSQIQVTDLNGNTRLWDGDQDGQYVIDMGPYEFGGDSTIFFQVTPAADSDCSDYACDLQSALNASAYASGLEKEIRLARGVYTGNFTYFPVTGNNSSLSILGGWSNDFSSRTVDPTNTILNGNRTGRVLTLQRINNTSGSLKVEGLTIKNGLQNGMSGGGLLAATYAPGEIEINRNIIEENESNYGAGGAIVYTHDNVVQTGAPIVFTDNIVRNNLAGSGSDAGGGGAFLYGSSSLLVANNLIYNNEVRGSFAGRGGGAYLVGLSGPVYAINNTVVFNRAFTEAGGLYMQGGGWANTDFHLYNNIIGASPDCDECREDIINAISDSLPSPGNSLIVSHNNFNELINFSGAVVPVVTENFAGDPMFASASDFHLVKGSPCIDTGTNAAPNMPVTDIEGAARPQDGNKDGIATANMGCYETAASTAFPWTMFLPPIIAPKP